MSGQQALAEFLGVSRVTRAHLVPVAEFDGKGRRRAALVALSYRTDQQDAPKTRRLVKELTGIPAPSQRRLDREHGFVQLVSPVFADLGPQPSQWYADRVAQEFREWGFLSGWGGRLFRQHGSIRSAATHQIGSSAAMRRLNKSLRRDDLRFLHAGTDLLSGRQGGAVVDERQAGPRTERVRRLQPSSHAELLARRG
jgi:hypothetical protein